jgi:predicted PurR-regulated permease PerM
MPDTPRRRVAIEVPWRTLLKLMAAVVLVWLWLKLVQLVLVLIVAALIAVTLNPIVVWLEGRGWKRVTGTLLVGFVLVATIGGFLWLTWASLADQFKYVTEHFGEFERDLVNRVPAWIRDAVGSQDIGEIEQRIAGFALRVGQSAASAVVVMLLGFILTLYLLIEGRPTVDWLIAFVPQRHRPRVEQTLVEGERVIFAYVAGNVITSIFAAVFVLVSLSLLNVPAALLLALLAGVFDFVPVLGFVLSGVPAVLLAGTVSTLTAVLVVALYVTYHFVENYFIAPKVYGAELRLSNLAVLMSFAIGAELGGVIGALLALPVAAAYPAVERIWLKERLGEDTVEKHKQLEHIKTSA